MSSIKSILFAGLFVVGTASLAMAQAPVRTTNTYTAQQLSRAQRAAMNAGFTVQLPTFVQAGDFFFVGQKEADRYDLTVTPEGQVYAGKPYPR
jgi:hypothetical protein